MIQPLPGIDHIVMPTLEIPSFYNLYDGPHPLAQGSHGLTGNEPEEKKLRRGPPCGRRQGSR